MNTKEVIQLARHHVLHTECEMLSSAEVCLADAISLYDNGDFDNAKLRALKSLKYTVGILHNDYKRASK